MDWFCESLETSDILRGLERFVVGYSFDAICNALTLAAGNLVLDANNLDRLSATISASIRSSGHTYLATWFGIMIYG
ncbi:hypothetical protein MA16_Dca024018 [Dendrobium catenatum]|uniref:Uncharacterized protein n=1 Tax=Dendrobium catenatum TaxID=906689 RepID=A0A2I0WZG1_9ASPA|nr:hypothetical protein MA16_Dca024018 [Dendrobium catenatum]